MAPLSGYTDLPFRRQCRRFGCRYAFTPLVEVGSVVYRNFRAQTILLRGDDEPWLGLQILGADPQLIGTAVRILRDLQFEAVDFNMGCPVRKVVKRGAGAAMTENPELARRCIERIVDSAPWPVTAKIRILDSFDPEPTAAFARSLEDMGIRALTVHGRTRQQGYSGPVKAEIIAAVQAELAIPVIANGSVFDRQSAEELRQRSECSRLMVARGGIGNPWIFRELADSRAKAPSHNEICEAMAQQVQEMIELYGEQAGLRQARKIILSYLVGRGYRRQLRNQVASISTRRQFDDFFRIVLENPPS